MKKERLFYLDLIRAISTFIIVLCHFNAIYYYSQPPVEGRYVFSFFLFNNPLGSLGVSLFFIISGASLMYVYSQKFSCKEFYKRRFLAIYPMFWLAYIFAILFYMVFSPGFFYPRRKWTFLLTILGMDGLLSTLIPNFYILGEWFLGCIIIIYVIFPILKYLIDRYPKCLLVLTGILYYLSIFHYHLSLEQSTFFVVHLPEFVFGMYFMKYIKKVKCPYAIISLLIIVFHSLYKPSWNYCLQATCLGISLFLILTFLAEIIHSKWIQKVCSFICKYSYAIFLVHHVVIYFIMSKVNVQTITLQTSYFLFAICILCTIIVAVFLHYIHSILISNNSKIIHWKNS